MSTDYLEKIKDLSELEAYLSYTENKVEKILKVISTMQDLKYDVHRYDLAPKRFHDYFQWLHDELLKSETEKSIVAKDLQRERLLAE